MGLAWNSIQYFQLSTLWVMRVKDQSQSAASERNLEIQGEK